MNPQQTTIEALLKRQLATIFSFNELLQEEHAALMARQLESLSELNGKKERLTNELEKIEQEQQSLLITTSGSGNRAPTIDEYIATLPPQRALSTTEIYKKFRDAVTKCRDQNQINGQIISANRQTAERTLAILRGELGPEEAIYGAEGHSILGSTKSKHLAKV